MIGADEEGDFSLEINPVLLEDNADYQCQVSSVAGPPLMSRVAKLTVFVAPLAPTVSPGPTVEGTSGQPLSLTCTSIGGKPAPEVSSFSS